jgi:Raf kinase inhibitor-like YbhB/YbcL family protein
MRLTSSAFADGETIPSRFTCDGGDLSPPLAWDEVPAGTRSFVLLCDDPDAPAGTWHHWAVYGIPADQKEIPQGVGHHGGASKQAINDFRRPGYSGPCPPHRHGPHHYRFMLLALSVDHLALHQESSCSIGTHPVKATFREGCHA